MTTPDLGPDPNDILAFWFAPGREAQWFSSDRNFDRMVGAYESVVHQAVAGDLDSWVDEPASALALVLVLDQFPRNIFRDQPQAFAADPLALSVAARAVDAECDAGLSQVERQFLYLPFMHAEDLAAQDRSCRLYKALGLVRPLYSARLHHAVIERFGRFPHRNQALGRRNTDEEQAFLDAGGIAF